MAISTSITTFDTSMLLNYYNAQLSQVSANASARSGTSTVKSNSTSATSKDVTPWSTPVPAQQSRDAQVLNMKNFIDLSSVPLVSGITTDTKMEQDNQKLFALYNAVNNLSYLAVMAKRDGTTDAQRVGYNTRFQAGLKEIQSYISSASFNLFSLQAQSPSSTVTSTAKVPTPSFDYTGSTLTTAQNVNNPLAGVSSSDHFTIAVSKGDQTTNVDIDLSKVQGGLSLGNIVTYVNQQLAAAGSTTRFKKALVSGTEDIDPAKSTAQYAMQVVPGGIEQISLSAPTSKALYVSGTSGLTTATKIGNTTTAADNQGRLTKLTDFSSTDDPSSAKSFTMAVKDGSNPATSTANATVVDASGNVYMLGNSTGDIGNQLNQGSQDVYLTKYDSAGKTIWSQLVGSAGSASGMSMALNPSGGVVVVGSTTAPLSTTAISNGKDDSFAIKYDGSGNQVWTAQIPTLNANSANAVSVDSSGNVYIGGQVNALSDPSKPGGVVGAGQVSAGGQDAYVLKLDSKGKIAYEQQFGTSGADSVAATAVTDSGDLVVASVQNGHAIVSKYAGGDATQPPTWTMDMGDLQYGGTIGGLVVKGNDVYISGTTRNGSLNANTVANAASGGTDAFVFKATDNGTSVTGDSVSYVGTSANDTGAGLTVGSDGTVYLTGSTAGTFAGQQRSEDKTNNMYVASVNTDGSIGWVNQYGGMDGQSTGAGIALDENGASVLDALGLPTGNVEGQANSDLTAATTLRAGDTFKVALQGTAARTFTITIDKGETLNSLVTKLNAQFGSKAKASINYSSQGAALKIDVSAGTTAKLIAGPANSDALGRLGITPQTLSKAATTTSSASSSSSTASQTYALGFSTNLDISTASGASLARAQLLNVLSAVQTAYQKSNMSTLPTSSTVSNKNSTMSAAATAYNNALNSDMSLALSLLTA